MNFLNLPRKSIETASKKASKAIQTESIKLINNIKSSEKQIKRASQKMDAERRIKYGLDENGQKTCERCNQLFMPGKFTPYQVVCKSCSKKKKEEKAKKPPKKTSGGNWVITTCGECGQKIRIDKTFMSNHCLDHCSQEERHIRMQKIQEGLDKTLSNADVIPDDEMYMPFTVSYGEMFKIVDQAIDETKEGIIDKFTDGDLSIYPSSMEMMYMWLLARGWRFLKTYSLYKEFQYSGDKSSIALTPHFDGKHNRATFSFCWMYTRTERMKTKQGKADKFSTTTFTRKHSELIIDTTSRNFRELPPEIQEDIHMFLELKRLKGKENDKN